MKKILLSACLIFSFNVVLSQIPIAQARLEPVGDTVTVSGIVTNGGELGTIRYLQDGTGGIAAFSNLLNGVNRGDLISVTGAIASYFNLCEITPVISFSVLSTGNTMPSSVNLSPNQFSENDEGEIVTVNNCIFTGSGVFQGGTNYTFISGGQTGIIRIATSGNPLVGQPIPTGAVNITGILSQFQSTYQLLPRDLNDIAIASSFYITSQPSVTNITQTGFDLNFTTNLTGSSIVEYGLTPLLELGYVYGSGGSTFHSVSVTGAQPAQLFYARVLSVNGNDTAFSNVKTYITQSSSSGMITCYFNRPVDNSVANSPSNLAIWLNNSVDDTLAAYIDRAQQSIDIAIYNFDDVNTLAIINAINNAYARGVQIRIISDGSNANNALSLLNPGISLLPSPTLPFGYYGIMHNKFVVLDAANANDCIVWTGATNWTDDQLNKDANNVIIFQDQSLAKVYTMEFEEMWGSNTNTPNLSNIKFGPDKTDNTPHELNIGGNRVECYFSPSDNVNNQILNTINTAHNELYFSNLVFTRFDLAYGIENRIVNHFVTAAGLIDDTASAGALAYNILLQSMGNGLQLFNHQSAPGLLHHKYLIVDQSQTNSDALVLTGSHNWSTTATTKNDENTVVVHNRDIANQFYQEFYKRFNENGGGTLGTFNASKEDLQLLMHPNPASEYLTLLLNNNQPLGKLVVFNSLGELVAVDNTNEKSATLNVSQLPSGIYMLLLPDKNIAVRFCVAR